MFDRILLFSARIGIGQIDILRVRINVAKGRISIYSHGDGLPVEAIPEDINPRELFFHLSDNINIKKTVYFQGEITKCSKGLSKVKLVLGDDFLHGQIPSQQALGDHPIEPSEYLPPPILPARRLLHPFSSFVIAGSESVLFVPSVEVVVVLLLAIAWLDWELRPNPGNSKGASNP
ncbi:hypothetical protein E2562_037729 [Oryza meyeriana var. granulata]|uniref:Uncharacterized protein n=1 Tax=Oryza meyeriana var. granulata TaxID=110450 RepID=A0A6G1C320_9ORYZ|nr:hypothetical protein E2562_037729 [Oryza meyeriana var. granulata]